MFKMTSTDSFPRPKSYFYLKKCYTYFLAGKIKMNFKELYFQVTILSI